MNRLAKRIAIAAVIAAITAAWLMLASRLGAQAPTHAIAVSWTYAQGTDAAVGFTVLRSQTSGGPYSPLNNQSPLPLTQLAYTDTGCPEGTTCYYVIQAVDAAGVGSALSNETSATMPGAIAAPIGAAAKAR